MNWSDEGYLLSKNHYNENSIIIEAFTFNHGKHSGIVYGGSSKKHKRNIQIGNKIFLNWNSKGENRPGYFNLELIEPISPFFFDDKKKITTILSATSILKILLPERQVNQKIYNSFNKMISNLKLNNWIYLYIHWELSLIKELGFEINLNKNLVSGYNNLIEINNKSFKIPKILLSDNEIESSNIDVKEALIFNKNLLIENFISPNNLRFPVFRNILENYYS